MVVAEEVCAVAADEVEDRDEPAVAAQPQGVALPALVDDVETDRGEQARERGAAGAAVGVDEAGCAAAIRNGAGCLTRRRRARGDRSCSVAVGHARLEGTSFEDSEGILGQWPAREDWTQDRTCLGFGRGPLSRAVGGRCGRSCSGGPPLSRWSGSSGRCPRGPTTARRAWRRSARRARGSRE